MSYEDKKYLSVREVSELMGVSRMQVVRWIHAGKLPAQKVGRAYVINRSDLGGIYKKITDKQKKAVQAAIERTLKEYGDVIRRLGKE